MTQKQLTALVCQWQDILRLKDWNLNVQFIDHLEAFGSTRWDKYKNAEILLCTPETLAPDQIGCDDIEVTLVHELLHLHGAKLGNLIKNDTPEDDALEEMIELVAQGLVALKRTRAKSKPRTAKPKTVKRS